YLIPAAALFPVAVAGACGTDVVVVTAEESGGGGHGGFLFLDGGGGSHVPVGGASSDGGLPDYVDPGCMNQPPPIEDFACDPYNQLNGDCLAGEGCYIYVNYPTTPCGQEVYG